MEAQTNSYNKMQLRYGVFYNDELSHLVNPQLVFQQNVEDKLDDIKESHHLRMVIYEILEETNDRAMLRSLAEDLTEIEFELQDLWGFPRDRRYHRFWEAPKCECPILDNMDGYPYMSYVNLDCPLHGEVRVENQTEAAQRSGSLESTSKEVKK